MSHSVYRQDIKALLDKCKQHILLNAQDPQKQLNLMFKLFEKLQQLVGETHSASLVTSCSVDEDVRDGERCLDGKDEQFQEAEALAEDPDFHLAELGQLKSVPCELGQYSPDDHGQLLSNERQLLLRHNSLTLLHTKLDKVANDQRRHLNLAQAHWQQIMHMLTESTIKENQLDSVIENEQQSAELVSCSMQEQQLSSALSQLQLQLDEANKKLVEGGAKHEQLSWELTNCKLELLNSRELASRAKLRELKKSKELNKTDEVKSMISRLQEDTATIAEHIKKHRSSKYHYESGEYDPMNTRGSHTPDHLKRLRQNYQMLTEKLEARRVAALMYEQDALTFAELQSIQRRSTLFKAAKDLLKVILEAENNVRLYECFLSALQKTDQQHIWQWLSYDDCDINSRHVQLIQSHYCFLVKTIELKHSGLLDSLYAHGVIDIQDIEYLEAEQTSFKRNEQLLSMLGRKTEQQFELFLDCLNDTEHRHVVRKLRGNLDSPGASSGYTEHQSLSSPLPSPLQTTAELTAGDTSGAAAEVVSTSSPIQRPQRMNTEVTTWRTLSHVISSKGQGWVAGVTVCDKKVFVLRGKRKEEIEQYEIKSFDELEAIRVKGLGDDVQSWRWHKSLTSCCINNCLYVNDLYAVFRVDLSTQEVISWRLDGSPCGLSVNSKGNVLVTCHGDNKIIEYSTRGSLVRSIQLQGNHVTLPLHTVQLTDGRYAVCHLGPVEGVSWIDQHGTLITSYRNSETTRLVNDPRWIVVVNDCILVADVNNNRIISLSSSLNNARELSPTVDSRLNRPCCMYFDQSSGRLFVGEGAGEHRILVFK